MVPYDCWCVCYIVKDKVVVAGAAGWQEEVTGVPVLVGPGDTPDWNQLEGKRGGHSAFICRSVSAERILTWGIHVRRYLCRLFSQSVMLTAVFGCVIVIND